MKTTAVGSGSAYDNGQFSQHENPTVQHQNPSSPQIKPSQNPFDAGGKSNPSSGRASPSSTPSPSQSSAIHQPPAKPNRAVLEARQEQNARDISGDGESQGHGETYPGTWQPGKDYKKGDFVEYDKKIYQANTYITTPAPAEPSENPDFTYVAQTDNPSLLKNGSLQEQLDKGVKGIIYVSKDTGLPSDNYDPNKTYQKGDIFQYGGSEGFHFVAVKQTGPAVAQKRAPELDNPPDKNPAFKPIDSTEPPGNVLSTVIRDGKVEKVPFSQRVEQSMQRGIHYLQKAIHDLKTFDQQPWDASMKQKMEKFFPGITTSKAGRNILVSELSMQLDRMEESVQGGLKNVDIFHQYRHPDWKDAGSTTSDKVVHLNVDKVLNTPDERLDTLVLHEFAHQSILGRDFEYLNENGSVSQEGDWAREQSNNLHWQWNNPDSITFGVLTLNGKINNG